MERLPIIPTAWQPEANLTAGAIRGYDNPLTAEQTANWTNCDKFTLCGFLRHRRVVVHPCSVDLRLDVFRYMTSRCQPLPSHNVRGWKYLVNCDGIGRKLAFPVLVKQSAHFSQMNFKTSTYGDLEELPRHPYEKISIRCATEACSI